MVLDSSSSLSFCDAIVHLLKCVIPGHRTEYMPDVIFDIFRDWIKVHVHLHMPIIFAEPHPVINNDCTKFLLGSNVIYHCLLRSHIFTHESNGAQKPCIRRGTRYREKTIRFYSGEHEVLRTSCRTSVKEAKHYVSVVPSNVRELLRTEALISGFGMK